MKNQLVKLILFAALAVAGVWGASAETVGVTISVNGGDAVDVGTGSGDGWTYSNKVLTLDKANAFTLSGGCDCGFSVYVKANAAITLSDVRINAGDLECAEVFNIGTGANVTLALGGSNEVYTTSTYFRSAFGIASGASLTMDGTGALYGGKIRGGKGCCVTVHQGGTFVFDGGSICDYGTGAISNYGSFTMNRGLVENCYVRGGGAFLDNADGGTAVINGGSISGCTSAGTAYIAIRTGSCKIYGGYFGYTEATAYFGCNPNGTLTVYGAVVDNTNTSVQQGYRPEDYKAEGTVCVAVGNNKVIGKGVTVENGQLMGGTFTFDPKGDEYAAAGLACGPQCAVVPQGTDPETYAVQRLAEFKVNGVKLGTGSGTGWSFATNETATLSGHLTLSEPMAYTLTGYSDLTLTVDVLSNATVTLDGIRIRVDKPARDIFRVFGDDTVFVLNGTNTVYANDGNAAIGVTAGARLKVRGQRSDGGDGDCLVGGRASGVEGRAFNVYGELVLEGGTIRDYYAWGGGGVFCDGGTFTMNGGEIAGCSSYLTGVGISSFGGGIYLQNNATGNLNGGTISGCSAMFGSAFASMGASTVNVRSGFVVSNNVATSHGTCFSQSAKINIWGGTYRNNRSNSGVFVSSWHSSTVNVYGGVVTDNSGLLFKKNETSVLNVHGGVYSSEPGSEWIVVGSGVEQVGDLWVVGTGVQSDAGKLLSGTCTFSPTNAEYVAAGLALSPGCEVSEKTTEPRTYVVTDESLTLTALTDASAVSLNWTSAETVLYRLSDGSWTAYEKGTTVNLTEGGRVSFVGTRVKTDADSHFAMHGSLAVSGHVTALWSGLETDRAAALEADCFACLFQNCVSLATAPGLPSTVLPDGCYRCLFKGCTGLSVVPDLAHVTSVGSGSCAEMFAGCTGIRIFSAARDAYEKKWLATSAAETAPEDWSTDMFKGTSGGFLSAPTAGAVYYVRNDPCYLTFTAEADGSSVSLAYVTGSAVQYRMGDDGAWLTYTAGKEIALAKAGDTVAFCGYNVMTDPYNHFTMSGRVSASGSVTSLTDAYGADAGVELDEYCYDSLFADCTALVRAPGLPAKNLSSGCYFDMFAGCTSLVEVATLPSLSLPSYCYAGMFLGCTSLTRPADLSSVLFLGEGCCMEMFADCTGIQLYEEPVPGCEEPWLATSAEVIGDAWNEYMFAETSGGFTGDPVAGEIYYVGEALPLAYPSYLASWSAAVSNRFDTWAETFGSRDPDGVYTNAFLLNVATNREAEAVGAFAIGSIVVTNGIVDITLPKPLAPATAFNGAAYLQCATNLPSAEWNDIESGRYVEEQESFFRLKLDFEHTLVPDFFPTEPEGTKTHRLFLR